MTKKTSSFEPFKDFDQALSESSLYPLKATVIDTLQINFGKLCNQRCKHCHVQAGPDQTESISQGTLELCLDILENSKISTVDITGGAPEMNPHFRWFIESVRQLDRHIMDRCNLTILLEKGQEDLTEFLKENQVEIIASLPYYSERQVDKQRGAGVFKKSIQVLKILNNLGYGKEDPDLVLNLVYNPGGAFLPPSQTSIESDFKKQLKRLHGIQFNHLYTIVNMPLGRFQEFLKESGNFDDYMDRLISGYNPLAAESVMCKHTLSVGWDGSLYDCDFNQMLGWNCNHGAPAHISQFDLKKLESRRIVTGLHCYGCTAGSGSSCGGAMVES